LSLPHSGHKVELKLSFSFHILKTNDFWTEHSCFICTEIIAGGMRVTSHYDNVWLSVMSNEDNKMLFSAIILFFFFLIYIKMKIQLG